MDMHISGSGLIAAGEYENIHVSGSGRLQGLVRCSSFRASGSCRGEEVECKGAFHVSGSGRFDKAVKAGSLAASGSAVFDADVTVEEECKCSGYVKCGGSMKCGTLKVSGGLDVGGDAEAEVVRASGRLNCGGLLNAEEISICFDTGMTIGSIGGSKIVIYRNSSGKKLRLPLLSSFVKNAGGSVKVEQAIEGDEIAVEGVCAQRISGRVVAIGDDCEIGLVQYSEQIEVAPTAKIGKLEKLSAPAEA